MTRTTRIIDIDCPVCERPLRIEYWPEEPDFRAGGQWLPGDAADWDFADTMDVCGCWHSGLVDEEKYSAAIIELCRSKAS